MVGVLSVGRLLGGSILGFSPASLFAAGEQGAWYDPSDLSTMFQNAIGTTPVTAVEQPVGLIFDKSKGLAVGAELVPAPYVGASSGTWAFGATSVTRNGSSAGQVSLTLSATLSTTKSYRVTFTVSDLSGDTLYIRLSNGSVNQVTENGAYSAILIPGGTGGTMTFAPWGGSAGQVTITNISVREIAGNHALQATSASRPVLSSKINTLTYTEQFDNAAWTKQSGCTVTANQAVAPDGTMTADLAVSNGSAGIIQGGIAVPNSPNIKSVWMRTVTGTATVILKDPNFTVTSLSCNLTTTWQRFSITETQSGGLAGIWIASIPASGIYLWGADLRMASDTTGLPAYQRVGEATDYDSTGFYRFFRDDLSDDTLNWTAPADIDYTVAWVEIGGTVTIQTAQSLSGSTDILKAQKVAGYVAVDRALTASESTRLTAWLKSRVGV